jgi:hypothetical protein
VLELLAAENWKIKLSKYSFAQNQIAYLGHLISSQGVATDQEKISAIFAWPIPSNTKELRSFLGLAGYYRKFVRYCGVISQPLTKLLKKGVFFVWTQDHHLAFEALKQALILAPVLALPNIDRPFIIETDACDVGVGAVLMQDGHPLAFLSKALGPKSRGLSTYEKEYMVILLAVQQWRSYLQQGEFLVYTDHKSLSQLNEQRLHTVWQHKVFTKLLGLQYKVVYKKGAENRVVDALSRRSHPQSSLQLISSVTPDWLLLVQESYIADPHAKALLAKLSLHGDSVPNYTLKDGLLRYKSKIWIGHNPALQSQLIQSLHNFVVGGHSGYPVTYRRLKGVFAWKGMKKQVHQFVQTCQVCLQAKPDIALYPGKLQPLPTPTEVWETVSLDFIEGLPKSGNSNCILVVMDKFTRYDHFLLLSHPYTTSSVAGVFLNEVYRLHGLPASIISDKDPIFTSKFWQSLFKLAGIELKLSSSYHPQTDS